MALAIWTSTGVVSIITTALICVGVTAFLWFLYVKYNSAFPWESTELLVFKKHYSVLQSAIQSPGTLAGILYANGIIDEDVRDRAQLSSITGLKSNQILLNAVEQAIKTEPQNFHKFLDILADESTTELLSSRMLECYNLVKRSGKALDPSSHAQQPCGSKETQHAQHAQRQPSISKETQTVMPFPQRLQISVPIHCATVKAVTTELSDNPERVPQDDDTWLTLAVSIRDSSSGVPLSCVVALQGEELTTPKGQMICFLSLKIDVVGDDQSQMNLPQARNPKAAYFIQRHTKNANYIISLNIHSVYDEDGLECIGYTVEHYTGFVSTLKTVERNAFKAPPLLKYEGKLVSKKFHKLMSLYTQMFYQGKKEDSSMIMSRVTSSDSTNPDIRLYMLIYKASERPFDVQTITQLEELFQKSHSLDNQNGFLLQADAMMALSQTYSFQGRTEKSLECIRHSRSLCFEVAPSHLTSCVFFNDARILISMHKGNMTPSIKRRILELLDRSIADSYYGTGWQRLMIFQTHVFKAMFCLNGVLDLHVTSPGSYTPTEEDISIAEQHLNAAPLELVSEIHMNKVIYYAALSDLNRWKENTKRAREYAEMAKQLCVEKGFFANVIQSLEARLKQLEPDTIDEILETYKDYV